jgi:hypothetical protein
VNVANFAAASIAVRRAVAGRRDGYSSEADLKVDTICAPGLPGHPVQPDIRQAAIGSAVFGAGSADDRVRRSRLPIRQEVNQVVGQGYRLPDLPRQFAAGPLGGPGGIEELHDLVRRHKRQDRLRADRIGSRRAGNRTRVVEGDRFLRGMEHGEGCQQVVPPLVITVSAVQRTDARPAHRDQGEQQAQPHVPGLLITLAQPGFGLVVAAEQAGHRRLVQDFEDRLRHP